MSSQVCLAHQPSCDIPQPSLVPCENNETHGGSEYPSCSCIGVVFEVFDDASGKCVQPSECGKIRIDDVEGSIHCMSSYSQYKINFGRQN